MSSTYQRRDAHPWTDQAGFPWAAEVTWQEVQGRYEPVRVVLDSDGQKALTSHVLRQFERHLVQRRETEAQRLMALVEKAPAGAIRDRAQRQLEKWQAEQPPSRGGRPRDDVAYLERVLAVYFARREGRNLLEALEAWEVKARASKGQRWHPNQDTVTTLMRRTREWDQDVGLNLLTASSDDVNALQRAWRLARGMENHTTETKGKKK